MENAQRHHGLVKRFVPTIANQNAGQQPEPSAKDVLIATRIRLVSEDQLTSGFVPAVLT